MWEFKNLPTRINKWRVSILKHIENMSFIVYNRSPVKLGLPFQFYVGHKVALKYIYRVAI